MRVQCAPPSMVLVTKLRPASSCRGFHGAHTSGCDEVTRAFAAGSTDGLTLIHCSLG